ncbi:MAG: hypothetical protein ACLFR1_07745 [Spirochaetia bacterium]
MCIVLLGYNTSNQQKWDGYYQIAIPNTTEYQDCFRILNQQFPGAVLSEENVVIEYPGFPDPVESRLDQINLDSQDPRYDPFLRNLPNLFRSENNEYSVFYIASDAEPFIFWIQCTFIFAGTNIRWMLTEYSGAITLLAVIWLASLTAILLLFFRNRGISILLAAVPWLFIAINSGPSGMKLCALCFIAVFAWQYRLRPISRGIGGMLLFVVPFLIVSIFLFVFTFFTSIGFEILSVLLLAALVNILAYQLDSGADNRINRKKKTEHPLFQPIRIMGSKEEVNTNSNFAPFAIICFVLIIPYFILPVFKPEIPLNVPYPRVYNGERITSERSESVLEVENVDPTIPNANDYVAHRAYISSFFYGRQYGVPRLGEQVSLSEYRNNGTRVVQNDRIIMTFDEAWFYAIMHQNTLLADFYRHNSDHSIIYNRAELSFDTHLPISVVILLSVLSAGGVLRLRKLRNGKDSNEVSIRIRRSKRHAA